MGELNLEKHGFEPLVETTENANKRYLNRLKGLGGQIKADNSALTGIWQLGFTFSSNNQRVVYATNNDQEITTVDPLNGNETVQGQISSTDPTLYIPPRLIAGEWDWNQETWRGEWFDPSNSGNLFYDISPFHPWWDGEAWLYYEEYLSNENTMADVVSTAVSNPPAYSSVWQEGNPWGIWDKWSSELGVSYRRFKFRITNKGAVDVENPALATVFFKPEGSNEVEEVMSVEWDGTNTSSPVYEVDPHQLKSNVDGTFYINAATMAFELDLAQKANRLSGEQVILLVPDTSINQGLGFAAFGASQVNPPPEGAKLAQVKFPGMNDSWYKDASITMSLVSGTGVIKIIAYDPDTGNQVQVPFSQNIANDFFHSKGAYHGWDWYVKAEQAGELQMQLQYTKGAKTMSLTRGAVVLNIDLDIDSNNNEGFAFTEGSPEEEQIEADGTLPGKFIFLNTGDDDQVPDWADGFNINPDETNDDELFSVKFTPFLVTLEGGIDLNQVEISIDYDDTNPALVTYELIEDDTGLFGDWYRYNFPNDGLMRVWAKNADEIRKKESINNSGDFLPANTRIKWSDLPKKDGSSHVSQLYLEGVSGFGKKISTSIFVLQRPTVSSR